ncbi:hypothetical protein AWC38_SpisGene21830 [Stylophora pistillata]|uniref:EGF-like domain-containing protein n=1 Tax=Stylophora pistillata TaxID=50429 RepID=A0A2B4RCL9_STYPI|nr:hypothetical protein AWC38_SpisGene21830 [Stylophora pistillata]
MAQDYVTCQNFRFGVDEDAVYNYILEGHVFRRWTVHNAAQCHLMCQDDCLCVSMNYFPQFKESNCELNDANKDMEPAAMKWNRGGDYYDLVRNYMVKDGDKYIPGKHHCVNRCCRTNPCLNGGVCQEICDTHSTRFNCTCPDSYTGLRCEKIAYPRSCKDIAENGASTSGIYGIFGSANKPFSVYCDLQSEPSFVWTLIQSFSFGEKDRFIGKAFLYDYPVNQDTEERNWNSYRLSKQMMKALSDRSNTFESNLQLSKRWSALYGLRTHQADKS